MVAPPRGEPPRLRLIDEASLGAEPADNMARDEALLLGAEARPTLRLYGWRRPAVSLGFFQRAEDAGPLRAAETRGVGVASEGFPIVRRLTGGGAILHRDELTYSIAAPRALLGEGGIEQSYARVHRAIGRALVAVGVPIDAREGDEVESGACSPRPRGSRADAAFLCYERRSRCDLLSGGRKLVGSAQRREGARVLQHGSIPLGAEANAPGGTTARIAAGRAIPVDVIASAIAREIAAELGVTLVRGSMSPDEQALASDLAREKYANPLWTTAR